MGRVDDLIAFLAARLDEAAQRAKGSPEEGRIWLRALRDVEADRSLLAEWQKAETDPAVDDQWNAGFAAGLRLAVQIRATRHSDHPDYRPEWKP